MIREFKKKTKALFFPVKWANSVSRWILGVYSPTGTVKIKNTANPGEDGSIALDVNMDSVARKIKEFLESQTLTENDRKKIKTVLRGNIDGNAIKFLGEHLTVDKDWLREFILLILEEKGLGDVTAPASPTEITGGALADYNSGLQTDSVDFSAENSGATLLVLSRAQPIDSEKVGLYFRPVTVSADGRIASIGAESSSIPVYPGV